MKNSRDGMYNNSNGKAIPLNIGEMEWVLRYGDEKSILKHRLYIAHIVSLYRSRNH